MTHQDRYANFTELANNESEGESFRIECRHRNTSSVAIIAPHAGKIEPGTGETARAIAGDDFSLYLFEGILGNDNYTRLHITSDNFEERRCLDLIAPCNIVVAIHGCVGTDLEILLGGRDETTKTIIGRAFHDTPIVVRYGDHQFQGRGPKNICNRGRTGKGLQIEITRALRDSNLKPLLVNTLRAALLSIPDVAA